MEWVEGDTVRNLLPAMATFEHKYRVMMNLCGVVAGLQDVLQLRHNDIQWNNVMVGPYPECRVTLIDPDLCSDTSIAGTVTHLRQRTVSSTPAFAGTLEAFCDTQALAHFAAHLFGPSGLAMPVPTKLLFSRGPHKAAVNARAGTCICCGINVTKGDACGDCVHILDVFNAQFSLPMAVQKPPRDLNPKLHRIFSALSRSALGNMRRLRAVARLSRAALAASRMPAQLQGLSVYNLLSELMTDPPVPVSCVLNRERAVSMITPSAPVAHQFEPRNPPHVAAMMQAKAWTLGFFATMPAHTREGTAPVAAAFHALAIIDACAKSPDRSWLAAVSMFSWLWYTEDVQNGAAVLHWRKFWKRDDEYLYTRYNYEKMGALPTHATEFHALQAFEGVSLQTPLPERMRAAVPEIFIDALGSRETAECAWAVAVARVRGLFAEKGTCMKALLATKHNFTGVYTEAMHRFVYG
jgi:hypothetical protein